MMTGAYFVGRKEILDWVNKLLQLKPAYAKIEECCNGAAYCQILDSMAPGKVNMKRVNFKANQEYQYVENYKVLQNAFKALGITKVIDVVALTRGKYQDNLEFLQWLKAYYEQNVPQNIEYDPVARRGGKPATNSSSNTSVATPVAAPAPQQQAAPAPVVVAAPAPTTTTTTTSSRQPTTTTSSARRTTTSTTTSAASSPAKQPLRNAGNATSSSSRSTSGGAKDDKSAELNRKIAELQLALDRAEQERDFYFAKLRDVEIWTQTHIEPNNPLVLEVQSILYAVDETAEQTM